MSRKLFFVLGGFFFLLFFLKTGVSLDPDFGWQLRTGQTILSSGIPHVDPFSYTMPNYPYVDHSWLTGVAMAKLFPLTGFPGLAIIFSALTLLSMGIVFSIKKKAGNFVSLPLFVLLNSVFLTFVTVRPLIFTWVMFSLLLWILWEKDRLKRWRLFIPLLFLVWANLHGGFGVGLIAYGLVVAVQMIQKKQLPLPDVLTLTASFLITLINPYGIGLWHEIWLTITDANLRSGIAEWQPGVSIFNPAVIFLVFLAGGLLFKFRQRFGPSKLILFISFLLLGISSIRHIPLLILLCIPILVEGLGYFILEIKNIKHGLSRFNKAVIFFLGISIFLFLVYFVRFLTATTQPGGGGLVYPEMAVEFLKVNKPSGQVFSTYEWGGYLIWKLPEKKVFVDGRMPSWQQDGYSAFEESQKIVKDEQDFRPVFAKYQIDTVLWPVAQKNSSAWEKILEKMNSFFKIDESKKDLGQRLLEARWVEVYQDSVAVVFRRRG